MHEEDGDTIQAGPDERGCHGCGQLVEVCAFCEREACPEIVCFHCMILDLREAVAEPHAHGG